MHKHPNQHIPESLKSKSHFCCGSACTLNVHLRKQSHFLCMLLFLQLSLCYVESLTSEPVISRTSPSLSMLGLQLNVKIRLYIPQTFSCLCLSHCTTTITHKCTHTCTNRKNFIQPHTFLIKQSLYIKYMEPDETNQLREGNQKGEIRGGSLRSFHLL